MRRSFVVFLLVVLPGTLGLSGCSGGKKSFTLKGTVTYQGQPVSSGLVRLHMAEDRMAMARIKADGSFEITDVFAGEAKVTIEEDPAQKRRRTMRVPADAPKPRDPKPASAPPVSLPAKYEDASTSGLVFTVTAGQPLDIKLQ